MPVRQKNFLFLDFQKELLISASVAVAADGIQFSGKLVQGQKIVDAVSAEKDKVRLPHQRQKRVDAGAVSVRIGSTTAVFIGFFQRLCGAGAVGDRVFLLFRRLAEGLFQIIRIKSGS